MPADPRWNYFGSEELLVMSETLKWAPDLPFSPDQCAVAKRLDLSIQAEIEDRRTDLTTRADDGPAGRQMQRSGEASDAD